MSVPRDAIPRALADRDQWVTYRTETRNGRTTKVPLSAETGRPADATKPASWTTLERALQAQEQRLGGANGIGFAFARDDGLVGIDLDDCIDEQGELHPAANTILERLDTYAERSPSKTGIHAILAATLEGRTRRKTCDTPWGGALEAYDRARFFTVTGDRLDDAPDEPAQRQVALDGLLDLLLPERGHTTTAKLNGRPAVDVSKKLETLRAHDDGFRRTWDHRRGDLADNSMSGYDLSLAAQAARHGFNDAELAALIKAHRDRWPQDGDPAKGRRPDYVASTIAKARETADAHSSPELAGAAPADELRGEAGAGSAKDQASELLGAEIEAAEVFGHGPKALLTIRLEGDHLLKAPFGEIAKAEACATHVVTQLGLDRDFTKGKARQLAAALHRLAKHHQAIEEETTVREWCAEFLRIARSHDCDLDDQASRWQAFTMLEQINPSAGQRPADLDTGQHDRSAWALASASLVLRDRGSGARLVRSVWFHQFVRRQVGGQYTPESLGVQVLRAGWQRRGSEGKIKATEAGSRRVLVWAFWDIPGGWSP